MFLEVHSDGVGGAVASSVLRATILAFRPWPFDVLLLCSFTAFDNHFSTTLTEV